MKGKQELIHLPMSEQKVCAKLLIAAQVQNCQCVIDNTLLEVQQVRCSTLRG